MAFNTTRTIATQVDAGDRRVFCSLTPSSGDDDDYDRVGASRGRYDHRSTSSMHDVPVILAQPARHLVMLTTIPVFMGYSGMVVLQSHVKERIGLDTGSRAALVFGVGVSSLYIGNLFFRLLHNVAFGCLAPKHRVALSYGCMAAAALLIVVPYYVLDATAVGFVFAAYAIAGVGIGTFESNVISTLTPLGHDTKHYAVLGIPIGFNAVSIGSFVAFAMWPKSVAVQAAVYVTISLMNALSAYVYLSMIPHLEFECTRKVTGDFVRDLQRARQWLPGISWHCAALTLDMFAVTLLSSVALYIFDTPRIPLFGCHAAGTEVGTACTSRIAVSRDVFFIIYYLSSFAGDLISRRIAYASSDRHPMWFLVFTALGVVLVLLKIAVLAPLGMFCIMFANGSIYAHTTRFIDTRVERTFNLLALSAWLFVGDVGSFVGSQLTQPLRNYVGGV